MMEEIRKASHAEEHLIEYLRKMGFSNAIHIRSMSKVGEDFFFHLDVPFGLFIVFRNGAVNDVYHKLTPALEG